MDPARTATRMLRKRPMVSHLPLIRRDRGSPRGGVFSAIPAPELIAALHQSMAEGAMPHIPIHVYRPTATTATKVIVNHAKAHDRFHDFHSVISPSGRCNAGRIQ